MNSIPFPPVDEVLKVSDNCIQTPQFSKFLHLLPEDKINFLIPAGIGDMYWTLCKLAGVKDAIFWVPDGEQHRCGGLAQMVGVEYGYLKGLETGFIWDKPGSPEFKGPGIYIVQPNRHLENGFELEKWYPELPLKYPRLDPKFRLLDQKDHVFVFLCNETYMSGQLAPEIWASTLRMIEMRHGQIVLCGAARDVDYAEKVNALMGGSCLTVYNKPLNEVMAWILSAKMCVGVASGLMILSICHEIPTLIAYPRHLSKMPGTWEPPKASWRWCYVDSIQSNVAKRWDLDLFA